MSLIIKSITKKARIVIPMLVALCCTSTAYAQLSSSDFTATPPLILDSSSPNVMLVMSNDHELSKKAYSDYSDLDGDGSLETTYDDDFTYSGYFDSSFCYEYSSGRFEPVTDISSLLATTGHSCVTAATGADWSGNFMNWATMTRLDIVRFVLYGGKRIVDTAIGDSADVTVLERAFLPEDVHAFVKVFAGDTQKYTPYTESAISLCNITLTSSTSAPLFRVAEGSWPQWSASEVVQCHYEDEQNSGLDNQPESGDRPSGTYDFNVRVQACKSSVDSSSSRCKAYSNSGVITYKPVGLLQEYGDNGQMNFGLMTGSYTEKIDGGVLRKDILPFTGNGDTSKDEVNLNSGIFINQNASDGGIVNTLDRFRIVNWNYTSNNYSDCDTYNIDIATFKGSNSSNRQCRNWGNPLSEIYLEALRYFTGDEAPGASAGNGRPTTAFNTDDSGQIASLPQLSWTDPLDTDNFCAACSIIVLSTGLNSFDKDDLGSVTSLWEVPGSSRLSESELDDIVDDIGTLEGITGNDYLVGNNGSTNDGICTSKTVTDLSDVVGLCPEIPTMEGGFDIIGLSYHAKTTDLRDDFEGVQDVNTFTVGLAESLPSFELDVNGNKVSFVPTCQAHGTDTRKIDQSGWNDCSLVDVVVESSDSKSGRILIAWEDSHWGNDYDMDGIARLEWCIGDDPASDCTGQPANSSDLGSGYNWSDFEWETSNAILDDNSVQFRVSSPQAAAGNALRFGYILSGVVDGIATQLITNTPIAARNSSPTTTGGYGGQYVVKPVLGNGEQTMLVRRGNYDIKRLNASSGNRVIYTEPAVYTASSSTTAGALLKNPLWYTAKYGSYNDIDGDGTPLNSDLSNPNKEWDSKDILGNDTPDGIPDNYYPIRNPTELITGLSQVFESISERISSGTAAAVVANSSTGLGAVYQAYYHPNYTDSNDNSVSWSGVLHSMFIDASGRFREDNGIKGTLENADIDPVVDIFFDETVTPNRTRFQRYSQVPVTGGPAATVTAIPGKYDLEDIGSIWNARDVLANISQSNMAVQRTIDVNNKYTQEADDYRYIFTYLDNPSTGNVGAVDSGEVIDFTHDNFNPGTSTNYRYLGLSSSADAMNLVKYIRGQDQSGWRSRLVDIPGDGTASSKYWVLSDIVHSSPLVVNPPNESYDITYGDESYNLFKQQYQRRRQMIYAGGNDGMLHAFSGGIWDSAAKTFNEKGHNTVNGLYDVGPDHDLGSEMWAYVPMNLLPHLQWLKEQDYPHVYYIDAVPQSYDVNIFTPDDTHPGGWGTILVAGMRLGGGEFPVDLDGDGTNDKNMRSAIMILDITDPEQTPQLIAEISDPTLGYTTSVPSLVKARVADAAGSFATPAANRWILTFGSGPNLNNLSSATSTAQDAKIFAYDLVSKNLITIHNNAQTPSADPSGFFGDFLSVDWNNDFIDDAIYVGTIEGNESSPSGRMKRIVLNQSSNMGLSAGAALMSDVLNVGQPIPAKPQFQKDRSKNEQWLLFGTGRLFTSADNRSQTQQSFYGIKEPASYSTSSLTVSDLINTTDILVETDGDIHDTTIGSQVTLDSTDLDTFNELYTFMDTEGGWIRQLSFGSGSPSERIFSASLVLGSSVVFSSYLPSSDLCTIEGDGFLYALNFRTGTAEIFGPFGDDAGVSFAGIELGQGAPSAPTAVVRTGDDVGVDGLANTGDLSVVSGSTTGVTNSTGFTTVSSLGSRLSWEILEIPF